MSSVQFVVEGKSYKSLEEMPAEVRSKVEAEMKQLNQKLEQQPFNLDAFFDFNQPFTTQDNTQAFGIKPSKPISWLYALPLIVLFNLPGVFLFLIFDSQLQEDLKGPFIFFCITATLFAIAVFTYIKRSIFRRKCQLAQGEVLQLIPSYGKHGLVYRPLIEFLTLEGKKIQTTTKTASSPSFYTIGQEVELYYDPENPSSTLVRNFVEQWMSVLLFFIIGLFLSLPALLESLRYAEAIKEAITGFFILYT